MRTLQFFRLTLICIFAFLSRPAKAGDGPSYPEVGKPCPSFFLSGIQDYPVSKKSLKDFKGKPFILDFFAIGCQTCFESMPKINALKKVYGPALDLIMVGREDRGIRDFFEKFKEREHLDLPVAFTKTLFNYFGIRSVPFVLWIDERGIVKAVTSSRDIKKGNIDLFLRGKDFSFTDESHEGGLIRDLQYDWKKPLLIDQNGGNDTSFMFRSLLSRWRQGLPQVIPLMVTNTQYDHYGNELRDRFQATGIWLGLLYQMAFGDTLCANPSLDLPNYYGHYAGKPELLIKDSSDFVVDFSTGRGIYCYSLIVPPGRFGTRDLQRMMQNDLKNYFPYDATLEEKQMPCWIIGADSSAAIRLKTGGGAERTGEGDRMNIRMQNVPMTVLIMQLFFNHQHEPPFIDETGITENIDLQLDGFADDPLDKIAEKLKAHGLLLHPGKHTMKVVVIRDRDPGN